MNSTMLEHTRPNQETVSSIARLADAITSRITPDHTPMIEPVATNTLTFVGRGHFARVCEELEKKKERKQLEGDLKHK